MRGDLVWFHTEEFRIDQFHLVMAGLAGRVMAGRHLTNGRLTMLSSRPGFEGDQIDTNNEGILNELVVTGHVTFQYWLRNAPESDVVITFSKEERGYETRLHFDGLDLGEACEVAREAVALSLRRDLLATSLGAVIDWPMDDGLNAWEDFFFRAGDMPDYVPPLLWYKGGRGQRRNQQGLQFVVKEPHWMFPELLANPTG